MGDDALRVARELMAGVDPAAAAERCGAEFSGNEDCGFFELGFFGATVRIDYPRLEFERECALPPHVQALLVYYLATSDGTPPPGDWCSFADLPNGRFYSRAFQGYSGDALSRRLGEQSDGLDTAVISLGGRMLSSEELATNADSAWVVPGLPLVPIAIVWWDADDEFPSRAEYLFDATAARHLPTDGCAVLGSWLTTCLISIVEASRS